MPEKTMVTIGDHCTLGTKSTVQCHSLEDASFKSDHIVIGNGATIGANTYVHYGVQMSDQVVLDADSFLMKGEERSTDSRWRGNPALEVPEQDAPDREIEMAVPTPRTGHTAFTHDTRRRPPFAW
jgi:acetyltransferase-like isoleucine patch superfamily enzyme